MSTYASDSGVDFTSFCGTKMKMKKRAVITTPFMEKIIFFYDYFSLTLNCIASLIVIKSSYKLQASNEVNDENLQNDSRTVSR